MQLTGSRDPALRVTFKEAVVQSMPVGGGLFVPVELPAWPDVDALLALSWQERSTEILRRLLGDEYTAGELAGMVREAFDFPLPLVEIGENAAAGASGIGGVNGTGGKSGAGGAGGAGGSALGEDANSGAQATAGRVRGPTLALELFHGPSLSFKDFGVRFLAAVLTRLRDEGVPAVATGGLPGSRPPRAPALQTILTATSGDTGAAVAAAFWRRPGFQVVVLYPQGMISPLQERQLACLGDNVLAIAIAGTFDDCQRLAKACFADRDLSATLGLTSANSINIARLLAQILYYFEAAAQLRSRPSSQVPGHQAHPPAPPLFAVPSGNFGNLCAGLYAQALGLRAQYVAATNVNRAVPDYLATGAWQPRPGQPTLSNAMDVGDPSNWERILVLHRHDWQHLRQSLRWGWLDDRATATSLRNLWSRGYQADPHGAVAFGVLEKTRQEGETAIFLATAHPAKFAAVLSPLGLEPALPPTLESLLARPLQAETLPAHEDALKARLRGLTGD
jgi:threonine synthase